MNVSAPSPDDTDLSMVVTVVHAPACHFCEDAQSALLVLAERYPLTVDLVDIRSDRGQALVRAHRSPMSPLVLINDVFFSFGRLPRRKLISLLDQREAAMSLTAAGRGGQGD